MIFNIAVAGKRKVAVTVYGAPSETVTITDGTNTYTVTTDSHGISTTTPEVKFGAYTVSGTKSATVTGFASGRSVAVDKTTTTVAAYPPGALFWLGNGDSSGDSLYSKCGGTTGYAHKPSNKSQVVANATVANNADNFAVQVTSGSSTFYGCTVYMNNSIAIGSYDALKVLSQSGYNYDANQADACIGVPSSITNNYSTEGQTTLSNTKQVRSIDVSALHDTTRPFAMFVAAKFYGVSTTNTAYAFAIWLE